MCTCDCVLRNGSTGASIIRCITVSVVTTRPVSPQESVFKVAVGPSERPGISHICRIESFVD